MAALSAGQVRLRVNGNSKTPANSRAPSTASGAATSSMVRKRGTPGETRGATTRVYMKTTIGAWIRYRL
jgi:hypothetical protein